MSLEPRHVHAELLPQDKLQLVKAYKNGDAPAATTMAAAAAQENTHHVLLVDSEQAGNASDNGCCASSQSSTVAHVGEQLAYPHAFVLLLHMPAGKLFCARGALRSIENVCCCNAVKYQTLHVLTAWHLH